MGQSQASSTSDWVTAESAATGYAGDATHYAELEASYLRALVIERNIPMTQDCAELDNLDRDMLINLLLSYDAGVASVVSTNRNCPFERKTSPICPLALSVLQKVRDAPGYMGCDIGGTLVKMVLALPREAAASYDFPDVFGESGRAHKHLELEMETSCGDCFVVRFLSGSTSQLEKAAQHLGLHRRLGQSSGCLTEMAETPEQEPFMTCISQPVKSLQRTERSLSVDTMEPQSPFRRKCSDWSGGVFSSSSRPIRCMATAGGGACKFAPLFREALRVDMQPVKELSAVIDGLLFLAARSGHTDCDSTGGCPLGHTKLSSQEESNVFTFNDDGVAVPVDWPERLFPMILVIMGSGVSILQVNSASDFLRVGGTACGGGTFLGLSRVITSARSFDEALELAASGDAKFADKLVSDIYGEDGCANLGLPGNLTACNFGKLAEQECSEADLARALLQMVTQQAALLASAFARHAGCIDRVFFVGGFVEETNWIARKLIATNFRNLGGCAYFLRHCDFLGALGSLRCALRGVDDSA